MGRPFIVLGDRTDHGDTVVDVLGRTCACGATLIAAQAVSTGQ